jgi:GntR family transcriptional regulator/MocR family aminotransferase
MCGSQASEWPQQKEHEGGLEPRALSPGRRKALLDWALRRGVWIVEDDYDAEFRYDRGPVGALQGLANDRVIYLGSASKTLAPALRLGWILAPGELVDSLALAKLHADHGSPTLDQLAFADFIERGELDRHLGRRGISIVVAGTPPWRRSGGICPR